MEHPNYYAIIPANVRYDKDLKANEKLMFGEITALANKTGECWASNQYFADLYGVTPQAVSNWISDLRKCGYITVEILYKDGTKEIDKRVIRIAPKEVSINDLEVSTNVIGGINKCYIPIKQNFKGNNTSNNNTYIYKGKQPVDEFLGDDVELKEAFEAFKEMRKKKKKPLETERALTMTINKLKKLGSCSEEWIAILDQSVMNGWTGIFPLHEGTEKKTPMRENNNINRDDNVYQQLEQQIYNKDAEQQAEWVNPIDEYLKNK